jgi:hypothetical protein
MGRSLAILTAAFTGLTAPFAGFPNFGPTPPPRPRISLSRLAPCPRQQVRRSPPLPKLLASAEFRIGGAHWVSAPTTIAENVPAATPILPRERFRCVPGMFNSSEVKVLYPT